MSNDMRGTANFCCLYSVVGMLFMLFVASLLTYQPLLVSGIEDYKEATATAYGAMATFMFTFLVSVVFLIQDAMRSPEERDITRRRRDGNEYEGIPQSMGVMQDYALNLDLPDTVQEGVGGVLS